MQESIASKQQMAQVMRIFYSLKREGGTKATLLTVIGHLFNVAPQMIIKTKCLRKVDDYWYLKQR